MQQKSLIVIYNPNARKGKIKEVMPYILSRLSTKFSPCEAVQSKSAEDMIDLARRALKSIIALWLLVVMVVFIMWLMV